MRYAVIVFFLFLVSLPSFPQEEVSVTEVMVWIKATDRSGKTIQGLALSEFEIFEDDQRMTPTCFEEIEYSAGDVSGDLKTQQSQPSDTSPVRAKQVAVILDLYNSQQAEYLSLRPKIIEFFRQIPASWEIMLATAIPGATAVSVPFTNDIKAVESKLDQISANASRDIEVLNRRRSILTLLNRGLSQQVVAEAFRLAQEYASEEMQMARESIKALEKFEKNLVSLKNDSHMVVLFISGGINAEPGRQYFDIIERRFGDSDFARRSILAQREGGADLWSLLRRTVAQWNRHNITFYTINTRGLVSPLPESTAEGRRETRPEDAAYLDDTQELMAEIADETGGVYFENSSNFKRGFDLILDDLYHQYLICYKAPPHKKPNQLHKIKVESRKSGVKLRHRKAYLD